MLSDQNSAVASVDAYQKAPYSNLVVDLNSVNVNEFSSLNCTGRPGTELWTSGAGLDELLQDP